MKRILVDCDDDTVLLKVVALGDGVACHTGERSCFFRELGLNRFGGQPLASIAARSRRPEIEIVCRTTVRHLTLSAVRVGQRARCRQTER